MKKLLILLLLVFSMTMAVTGCLSVTVPTSYSGADSSVSSVIAPDSSSVKPSSSSIKPSSSSSVKPSSSSIKPSSSSTKPSSSSVAVSYLITFKNGQETLQETSFVKGEKIVYTGETPAKASTVEYTYTFKGWSLTENGSVVDLTNQTVSKATTYYAVFTQAVRKYTITWRNNDGATLKTESLAYGTALSYSGTPTLPATEQYTYTFKGWYISSLNQTILKEDIGTITVTGNLGLKAVYNVTTRKYTVTWNVEGTKTTTSVEYGKAPTNSTTPTKSGYEFIGWSTTSGGEVVDLTKQTITGAKTYYAVFKLEVDKGVWDGEIPTLASGATVDTLFTKDSSGYYLIQSAQDLATLSALSNGKDFGSGLKFKQTINIDLSANNWLPICDDNTVKGNWNANYYAFCGTFDGGNKTITFNENYTKEGLQLGLFRALGSGANISNIIFNGKATVGGYYGPVAGIIVGDNVKISNVTNNVNITSIMKPSTTPTALDKYANVILGGVVGLVEESVGQNIIFENCTNNGTITGVNQSRNLGGIVANVKRGNTVNLINCSNTASITGGAYAGGIVGIVEQWGTGYTTRIEMTGCTNSATITGYDLDGTKKTATIEIGSASPYLGLLIGVNHATGTTSVWDGTYPTLASGATVDTLFTKDSSGYYLIQSAQDLATLSVLSRGADFGSGLKFKVTSDIDMSAGEWVPICNRGTASTPNYSSWTWKYFLGAFDGNGHTITIKMDITSDTAGMAGALFEGIKGSVSNVVIKGSIKVKTRAGALCYMASGATISNITSYMTITATASGTVYLGGIVGAIDKVDSITTITNCKNYGVVSASNTGSNVGGIVGSLGKGFAIINCINKANITGKANVGGILGYVANTITSFEVTSCTNSGVIKANNIVSNIDYGTNANGRGGLLVGNYGCKTFTIKFNVNGTESSSNVVAGNLPSYTGTPTKPNENNYTYEFTGWSTSANGSVVEITPAVQNTTYYAIFKTVVLESVNYIDTSSTSLTESQKAETDALLYKNTINIKPSKGPISPFTADVSVLYCEQDGYYYMYGTFSAMGQEFANYYGIVCYRSKNLTDWEAVGTNKITMINQEFAFAYIQPYDGVLTYDTLSGVMTETEFNNYKQNTWIKYGNIWAPSVFYDDTTKQYIMYSSGQTREDGGYALFIATSKNPAGPFIPWRGTIKGGTYQNGTTFASKTIDYSSKIFDFTGAKDNYGNVYNDIDAIDAEPFVDPITGEKYLYFVGARGANMPTNNIFGVKMIDWFTPDMSTLTLLAKPNYKKVTDTSTTYTDEADINEGPCIVYNEQNKYYYMTFSVQGYNSRLYGVKQAIATSPLGLYEKIDNDKGGRVLSCEAEWIHRAGTGHHTFIMVGNERLIVYAMHDGNYINNNRNFKGRCIGIDKVVWVKNADGLLVMASGPSYDYRMRPDAFTGYTNVASGATISANQMQNGANLKYLTDGAIDMLNNEGKFDFNANKEQLILNLNFANAITLKGIMLTNSKDINRAFDKISKIEIDYLVDGVLHRASTNEVGFNWTNFYTNNKLTDGESMYIPGCNSTAIFNEIQNVCNIKIYIEPQVGENITGLSVAEIAVIGK